jgi:hypothetical protein
MTYEGEEWFFQKGIEAYKANVVERGMAPLTKGSARQTLFGEIARDWCMTNYLDQVVPDSLWPGYWIDSQAKFKAIKSQAFKSN